jgi:hypothetical protein
MVMKAKKGFDCLEFVRKVQAEIYEEIRGLTLEEQVEYVNHHAETGPFRDWWKKVREGK